MEKTAMLMAGQMHPPFLFWSCQKRNGPCTVQREKTLRRVGLRRRRPPAAGGGWLAIPCGSQGRKRPALGETSSPGKSGIPSSSLPAAAHAPVKNSQRQRKEKQLDATTTPTRPAPSATGRKFQKTQKAQTCPKVGPNRSRHRYADPRRAEGHCTGARLKRFFLLHRARRILFLSRTKREWGAHPCGNSPLRERRSPLR